MKNTFCNKIFNFRLVERAKYKFESYSAKKFPERKDFLDALFRTVALAYIDPRNLTILPDENTKDRYLKRILGLVENQIPRASDVAWTKTYNVKRAFSYYRRSLALSSQDQEIIWIFHELSKLFIEVERYDLAR